MQRLTFADIEFIREQPGKSLLLFITDRCPVECAHCSVDSRHDSPTISDFGLFKHIVQGICAQPTLELIGISGGEPFVERRGLMLAMELLDQAQKNIVLYTRGIWATSTPPLWIREVIRKASCIILSTDAFHAAKIDDDRYIHAARTIAGEGTWIVVQVLNVPAMVQKAEWLLLQAFGSAYHNHAELHLIPPLTSGRGNTVFFAPRKRPGNSFGRCPILTSPVLRYDGILSPCCNEGVITGKGPERLRVQCFSSEDVTTELAQFATDPLLKIMSTIGVGMLTHHQRFAHLAQQQFGDICQLCWAMQEQVSTEKQDSDRFLSLLASLPGKISPSN